MEDRPLALVLGAKVSASGAPSRALLRRTQHAIALFQVGQVSGLILSGGGAPISEAEVMAQICRAAGLPERALHLEPKARTTADNLRFAAPISAKAGADLLIVTDTWHLARAQLAAKRLGLSAAGSAPEGPKPRRRVRLRETLALLGYWLFLRQHSKKPRRGRSS